ncbi:MAG: ABC transporter permease, partial [Bacteroidales bacterium]|nr:ABC transporter permease [Bacteroidales bacterium]
YRLIQTQHYASGPLTTVCMPGPIAKDIKDEIPEIANSFMFYSRSMTVNYGDKVFTEDVRLADPELFEMFDFEFIEGNPNHIFDELKSIVITDKMANKLFEDEDPMGKLVTFNNDLKFKVTGIIKETPKNSSFRFDICFPFKNIEEMGQTIDRYGWNSYYVYIELNENINYLDVNQKINKFLENKSRDQSLANGDDDYDSDIDLFLFPLKKIHLYSYRESRGAIQFIYIFSAIAIFIILIACINFMNLATARSAKRAKEISIRKSVGADRQNLIRQFLGESLLISFCAMILAIILVYLLLPWFNILVEKELTFDLTDISLVLSLVGITVTIGILAGSYPAFYLSAFNPVKAMRNGINKGKGNFYFRRALVVFQFVLSIALIISTIVVKRQLNYLYNNKLGMDLNEVSLFTLRGNAFEKYDVLKNDLRNNPNVLNVTRANSIPFYIGSNSGGISWEGKDTEDDIIVGFAFADEDYIETMGMQMADGRFFSKDIQSDTSAVVINKTAAKAFSLESPVGKWLSWGDDDRYHIIGVINDFHHLPMQQGIDPLTMYYAPDRCRQMFVKTRTGNYAQVKEELQSTWEANAQGFPYEPKLLKEIYENIYTDEAKLIQIIGYFAILAIFISCLGLFALSTYMAEQRTKEIGIRKILGASTSGIVSLISREFVKWVIIANVIAWPVAWFAMKNWLDGYVYHTKISVDIFGITLLISMSIALITITYQSISTAIKKPVNAIKYE